MTSKYWRGPHGLTHPKSFVALTNLWCFGYFRKADTMFMFLWNMQRYGGVNSFLWTAISCDWFKREPLPNDNIKYSELQFNWYDCLMSCDNVSIMKRVLECCQTNLLDRVMSEWSGCASPSVTKALPFLTSCEPPDTQHVLHFLLVSLRSPTPSLSLKWPATDATQIVYPGVQKSEITLKWLELKPEVKFWDFKEMVRQILIKFIINITDFWLQDHQVVWIKINQMSQWIKRETNQILRYVSIQLFTQIMQIISFVKKKKYFLR